MLHSARPRRRQRTGHGRARKRPSGTTPVTCSKASTTTGRFANANACACSTSTASPRCSPTTRRPPRWMTALRCGQQILTLDPLREDVHRELIRLHLRRGHRALALHQYEQCRAVLDDELGVEPMEETRALCAALLPSTAHAVRHAPGCRPGPAPHLTASAAAAPASQRRCAPPPPAWTRRARPSSKRSASPSRIRSFLSSTALPRARETSGESGVTRAVNPRSLGCRPCGHRPPFRVRAVWRRVKVAYVIPGARRARVCDSRAQRAERDPRRARPNGVSGSSICQAGSSITIASSPRCSASSPAYLPEQALRRTADVPTSA